MLRAIFIGDDVPWFLGSMCVFFFDQTLQLTPDNFTSWDSLGNHVALKNWIFPSFAESGSCSFSEKKSQNFESWKKLGLFRNPRKNAGKKPRFFFLTWGWVLLPSMIATWRASMQRLGKGKESKVREVEGGFVSWSDGLIFGFPKIGVLVFFPRFFFGALFNGELMYHSTKNP